MAGALYSRELRAKRKARGVCTRCGRASAGLFRCGPCDRDVAAQHKKYRLGFRTAVLKHYGVLCVCCKETNRKFLTLDHTANNGNVHRRTLRLGSGWMFYKWVIENGYPTDLQTLCFNCNYGKRVNGGVCPHLDRLNEAA